MVVLVNAAAKLRDGKKLKVPGPIMARLDRTMLGDLLRQYGLI